MADANRQAVKRTVHNDAQIAVENVGRVNTWTLLHSDMQHEMHNTDPQAH